MKRKTKRILKNVAIILSVLTLVGVVAALINNNLKNDNEINPKFSLGSLNENGEFVESNSNLVTLESFEVGDELKVSLEFDSDIKYQIFFYDENDNYLAKTEVLTKTNTPTLNAGYTYARIVITPIWDKDVAKDDQVIKWYQKYNYVNQLTITVVASDESLLTAYLDVSHCECSTSDSIVIKFEEGMTWAQWCDSDYNTIGLTYSEFVSCEHDLTLYGSEMESVQSSELIVSNMEYVLGM